MTPRLKLIAIIVITGLIISTFAAINSTKAVSQDSISVTSVLESAPAPEVQSEAQPALNPNRLEFHPKFIATRTVPNFAQPLRRVPIRRKGQVRH